MADMMPDALLVTICAHQTADALIDLMDKLRKLGDWLGVSLDEYRKSAENLLLREIRFLVYPTQQESLQLEQDWSIWADEILRFLQDAGLDLNLSPDRKLLDDFLHFRSIARSAII